MSVKVLYIKDLGIVNTNLERVEMGAKGNDESDDSMDVWEWSHELLPVPPEPEWDTGIFESAPGYRRTCSQVH